METRVHKRDAPPTRVVLEPARTAPGASEKTATWRRHDGRRLRADALLSRLLMSGSQTFVHLLRMHTWIFAHSRYKLWFVKWIIIIDKLLHNSNIFSRSRSIENTGWGGEKIFIIIFNHTPMNSSPSKSLCFSPISSLFDSLNEESTGILVEISEQELNVIPNSVKTT